MDSDMGSSVGKIAITFAVFLFSTACHEAAHAWMAYKWGDTTGKDAGQLTLDPIPHIRREPFGMLVLPLLLLVQSGGTMLMGWASTPVTPSQMRDPKWGQFWTSAAGPLTNLTLAVASLLLLKTVHTSVGASLGDLREAFIFLLETGLWLNLLLMVFNFLPIPPLDGGAMLQNLLPASMAEAFDQIRPFGFIILLALGASGVLGKLVNPVIQWAFSLI